jgi:hypothetical protein
MLSRADLEAAAEAGVIQAEQVAPLAAFLGTREAAPAPAIPVAAQPEGEEPLRFIRNFHDVFLATGIVLLAIGLGIATVTSAANLDWVGAPRTALAVVAGMSFGCSAILWALAEAFSRRRRLFLPSIALCIAITGYGAATALFTYVSLSGLVMKDVSFGEQGAPLVIRAIALAGTVGALLTVAAFYLRFRLPFSLGLGGSVSFLVLLALTFMAAPNQVFGLLPVILLLGGVLLFAAGLWFDTRDPQRTSRLSDNGFWLHLAAAPMILNGSLGLAARLFNLSQDRTGAFGMMSVGEPAFAAVTLLIVALLGFLSLLINRRALIVSALLTTGVAVGVLMNSVGLGAGALAASTLLVLGAGVLILGASWHKLRRALLSHVKPDGSWARIFPAEAPE